METAARLAHTVKGVASNLGAKELFPAAADLEKAIKQNEFDGIDGLIESFGTQLQIVMGGIRELEARDAAAREAEVTGDDAAVDTNAVRPLLVELAELLESDLMEAMSRLEALEQHLGNSQVRNEFSQLEEAINGFDTDSAAANLTRIAEKLDIAL